MKDRLQELQETLWTDIPITKHLGIIVESYHEECLTLQAPFEKNRNHKGTAFAGSLNALVTLAGWSLLWLVLHERGIAAEIVIQDSGIRYLLPVTRDFSARCYKPDSAHITHFETMLRRKGKARIEVCAEIWEGEDVAVSFTGRYVASLHQRANSRLTP